MAPERSTRRFGAAAEQAQQAFLALIDDFYEEIDRHEATRQVITGGAAQVERSKGSFVLESAPGRGTTGSALLPRCRAGAR